MTALIVVGILAYLAGGLTIIGFLIAAANKLPDDTWHYPADVWTDEDTRLANAADEYRRGREGRAEE